MNGLKINIGVVKTQGENIVTSANNIGTILENMKTLVTNLGGVWRDAIYDQAASEMNSNIADLTNLQTELSNLGTQIKQIADTYESNKNTVKGMFQ